MSSLTQEDKEWMALTMENASFKAIDAHREKEHGPLNDRLDDTRKTVWVGAGIAAAVGALLGKLLPGNGS